LTHVLNNYYYSEESPSRISNVLNGIVVNYYLYNDLSNNYNSNSEQKYSEVISEIEFELCKFTDKNDRNIDCPICYNKFEIKDCLSFNCNHNFCSDCSVQLFKNKHINCPICRSKIIKIYCYNDEIIKKFEKNNNTLIIDAIN
jgi:DNA-directed RNA polymerase subunit RPC12/RpoP